MMYGCNLVLFEMLKKGTAKVRLSCYRVQKGKVQ